MNEKNDRLVGVRVAAANNKRSYNMSIPGTYFNTGPFASASFALDEFSNNLYFAAMLDSSLKRHQEIQRDLQAALLSNDEEAMQKSKKELDLYEGVFNLTLSYNLFEELES